MEVTPSTPTLRSATTHASHFEEIFGINGESLRKWVVCQMADSASVNIRVTRILNIPHVGCLNQRLNSQVNDLVFVDAKLLFSLTRVKETMTDFRSKLTNRALLQNLI